MVSAARFYFNHKVVLIIKTNYAKNRFFKCLETDQVGHAINMTVLINNLYEQLQF